MDKNEIAIKMLKWAEDKQALDALEAEIEEAVMKLGQTFVVGDVSATYSAGRTAYDYQGAVISAGTDPNLIDLYTKTPDPVTDWRGLCVRLGLDAPIKSKTEPSVTLKIKTEPKP